MAPWNLRSGTKLYQYISFFIKACTFAYVIVLYTKMTKHSIGVLRNKITLMVLK